MAVTDHRMVDMVVTAMVIDLDMEGTGQAMEEAIIDLVTEVMEVVTTNQGMEVTDLDTEGTITMITTVMEATVQII